MAMQKGQVIPGMDLAMQDVKITWGHGEDMGKTWGRHGEDMGKTWGRHGEDMGKTWGRWEIEETHRKSPGDRLKDVERC